MNYSVVIPAHNEAFFLQQTLNSLVNQSKLPLEVIVVNDNSTDATESIIDRYQESYDFIKKINHNSHEKHVPGAKVIDAFYAGFYELNPAYDIIVKLDADLILPENYFQKVCEHFQSDKNIGMASGLLFIEKRNQWTREKVADVNHVRGPIKAYKKECFEQIGGLKRCIGWDTADVLLARFHGWKVKVDQSLFVKHLRPTGRVYDVQVLENKGRAMFKFRYGLFISLIAIAKAAIQEKNIRVFRGYLVGYAKAFIQKDEFLVSKEAGIFIRKYRRKMMLAKLLKMLK